MRTYGVKDNQSQQNHWALELNESLVSQSEQNPESGILETEVEQRAQWLVMKGCSQTVAASD